MRISSLLTLPLLMLLACSDPPNVGGTCMAPAKGSDDGLTCDTAIPAGYCTKPCATAGSTSECPEGSVCDEFSGGAALSCVKICQQQADCRLDLECIGTSGSRLKGCKIKP